MKLAENGFAKIGMGELCHANWVKTEIDNIRACEPEARFVLVGYDLGGGAAVSVARDLHGKGVPVEAVVLLDPLGCPKETCGVPTLLITSGKTSVRTPHSSRIVVTDSTHFSLPAHATTVAIITDLLREIAVNNCEPETDTITEWSYPHAPEMRGTPNANNAKKTKNASQWNFLADRPGTTRPIQTQTGTHTTVYSAQPAAPATHAGPVVIKP
jgi:pimeloyl-ACP methyl ester carboxylesterase